MRTYFGLLSILVFGLIFTSPSRGQSQSGFSANPTPTVSTPTNATASDSAAPREGYDPLLDLPPLQHNTVTLMGGFVLNNNEVMNRMTFRPFGTKEKLQVHFDTRTHFYLDGRPITEREIKPGQRIYLDTMLDHDRVFAKTIWIRTTAESGVGRGQIISFDSQRRIVTVRDQLSLQPVKLQLTSSTAIRKGTQTGTESDLVEGALVDLDFGPQRDLRSIRVLAAPGSVFAFSGRVTYVDLSQKLIAIDNRSDGKKYDISMDAIADSILHQLREGEEVSVSAVFDGDRYSARTVDIAAANSTTTH